MESTQKGSSLLNYTELPIPLEVKSSGRVIDFRVCEEFNKRTNPLDEIIFAAVMNNLSVPAAPRYYED